MENNLLNRPVLLAGALMLGLFMAYCTSKPEPKKNVYSAELAQNTSLCKSS